jgi:hypothetical protein
MGLNAYNQMIPLSENDRTQELLERVGIFMIKSIPPLIAESVFWGKSRFSIVATCW